MTGAISRRNAVKTTAALGAAAFAGTSILSPAPTAAADDRPTLPGNDRALPTSLNGWELAEQVDAASPVWTRPVPGTPLAGVPVRIGAVEWLLVHVIRRFHYEIDELRPGDVGGWLPPGRVDQRLPESNRASGTAVVIRPTWYPPGTQDGFFDHEQVVIRDILAELDGIIRWGGDDDATYEALFSIDVSPGDERLEQTAAKVRQWRDAPGKGPGAAVNVFAPERRRAARSLARRQGTRR